MTIYHYLLICAEAIALALVPVILLQRKGPTSTFAWILTLIFLPVLGVMLFLLFGRTKIRDHRQLTFASAGGDAALAALAADARGSSDFAGLERSCYQVSQALTHLPATLGNEVTMLVDGDATYDAIGTAIDAAERHVHVEYYLIKDDGVGRWFGERLALAARRGVAVRLIRDGYGSLMLGTAWMRSLMTAGVQVRTFLPMRSFITRPASLRNHRKIVVVDGKIGFTGGINICDEHSRAHLGQTSWRDIHLRLRGPAVAQLQAVFQADWQYVTKDAMLGGLSGPAQPACGSARVAIIPNGPDTTAEAIHRVFFTAIAGAEREILITSPYFGPDDTILVALEVAALRGLVVKIVLPARSNHPVTLIAGRSLYDRLLEAGVHIYQYQPGMIHSKTLLIDRRLALIGSSNMDLRSFRLNFEVHALVHDEAVSRELLAVIEQYLAQSERIDLAHWRSRGVGARVLEGACRLVSPLL